VSGRELFDNGRAVGIVLVVGAVAMGLLSQRLDVRAATDAPATAIKYAKARP
jgi:hypothetical protein